MRLKKLIPVFLVAGLIVGVAGFTLMGSETAEADSTLEMESSSGGFGSTALGDIYIVEQSDASSAIQDNLANDPIGYVVASADASEGFSIDLDWGTNYVMIVSASGQDNEVSADITNMRVGIDGDYWGDGDGSVDMPTENAFDRVQYASDTDHIYVNFQMTDTGFTLDRDETASVNEILLQAYF